ncbi:ABC transporter ATP-binding protein [Desulfococcaceae bacterium HSG9]|nr:ABC transporter ATP-binding protein [Desulfococcaceae bacterium HSG9]
MVELLNKLAFLIDKKSKRKAVYMLGIMLFGAGFEAIGVGLIFPFISLMSNPDLLDTNEKLNWLFALSRLESHQQFVMVMAVVLFALFLLKGVYIAFMNYAQFSFAFKNQVMLSRRLFSYYLQSPYALHIQRNSSELLKNVNSESLWVFHHVMVPCLTVVSESIVLLFISSLLIWTAPVATLTSLLLLGCSSSLFYWKIRKKARMFGKKQQFHMGKMIQWVNQGIGGIKDVKIKRKEKYFVCEYTISSEAYAHANIYLKTVSVIPRLFLEVIGIGSILLLSIFIIAKGQDIGTFIPYLGLFAMAAMRMIPSVNRIISSLTGMRFFAASVDAVYGDLANIEQLKKGSSERTEPGNCNPIAMSVFKDRIEIRQVTFYYPKRENAVLKNISLKIAKGSLVGFAGTSGSGKSTLIDVILGLMDPQKGCVLIDNKSIKKNLISWQQRIGYIPQFVYLLDDTIRRNVAFGELDSEIDDNKVWQSLQTAKLATFVQDLTKGLNTIVGENGVNLSGGQKQRLGIARALYKNIDTIVMDEATSALDAETESKISNEVFQLKGKKTILMVAHRLTALANCDCIFLLKHGEIANYGTFEQLKNSDTYFQSLLHSSNSAGKSNC